MKKAKVRYYAGDDNQTEVVIVQNAEDFENYGKDCVDFESTLLHCLSQIDEYGPVIINPLGGMCNLKHLSGDNSDLAIYS